jgi:hypothetical protein
MQFKEWLFLNESIIIQNGKDVSVLGKSRENGNMVEFSYGAGQYHSSFEVWPFSENRQGYVQISDGPASVVGIIKKTPIEPGNGADRAFIKSLTSALASAGHKPLPYKEGDSQWMGVLSAAGVDDDNPVMKGLGGEKEFGSTKTPEMGKASTNATKATSSVSFGRMSGSWAYFIRVNPGSASWQIEKVLNAMKNAAKPLIENDIIDQYRVVKGWNYKAAEVVWSNKGRQEHDDDKNQISKSAGYIKFLAERMLARHPKARDQVMKYFRHSWDKDVQPSNNKVPLDDLVKYIGWQHNESPFLNFFIEALRADNERMYDVMEDASKTPDADEAIRRFKEISDEDYDYITENPRLWMTSAISIFSMSDMMSKYASGNFERFKKDYEEGINSWLGSGEPIRKSDVDYLKKLSEYIEIKGKDQLDKINSDIKQKEEEQKKKQEQDVAKAREVIKQGDFKYMQIGKDGSWKDIPRRHLNGEEVEVGELAKDEDIVDKEDVFQAAHEKASEEAWFNAEEKKSETYGQDKAEVESDIDYEWDDYIEDRFEDGEFEGVSEEDAKSEIKNDYFDDFVDWKREKLKKEEEEESWRYEPEPEESDVRKYEDEIAEEKAYEQGLVIFKWPEDSDEIEVWLHSKNMEAARKFVRKSIEASMKEKDRYGEPILDKNHHVSFTFADKGSGEGSVFRAREV